MSWFRSLPFRHKLFVTWIQTGRCHRLPWEPTTFIFRGYNAYMLGCKTFIFHGFLGPRLVGDSLGRFCLFALCQGVVCANFLRSRSAEVGRGQPRSAKVGRGEPRWAEVGRGGPRSAELGRGGPRWAEVSRGGPRSAEVGRGQPIMTKLLKSY